MSHPRRLRTWKVACVQTRHRKPSSFGSKIQPRPLAIASERASVGSGSRSTTSAEPTASRHGLGYEGG